MEITVFLFINIFTKWKSSRWRSYYNMSVIKHLHAQLIQWYKDLNYENIKWYNIESDNKIFKRWEYFSYKIMYKNIFSLLLSAERSLFHISRRWMKSFLTYTQFLAAKSLWTSLFLWRYCIPLAIWSAISTTSCVVRALGGPSLLNLHLNKNLFMFL